MAERDRDFLNRLLATFTVEAGEHLEVMTHGLLELEKGPSSERQTEILESIFREAHSLKGAARAVNRTDIETICQSLENVFAAWKRQDLAPSAELFDVLQQALGALEQVLPSREGEQQEKERSRIPELIRHLESASKGTKNEGLARRDRESEPGELESASGEKERTAELPSPVPDTVRISTAKLDSLLLQAEELLSAKLAASERTSELRALTARLEEWRKEWAKIHPELRSAQRLLEKTSRQNGQDPVHPRLKKLADFLDWNHGFLMSLESKLKDRIKAAEREGRALGHQVDNLLEDTKKGLMLPFSGLLGIFPKLVRDLSRDQGKDVELVIEGGEIEVDRRILEEIKDPLIHLVRNCIDHGIEKPEEREKKNKPPRGRIAITVGQKNGGKVDILVADDGAGIDPSKVRETALRLGIVGKNEVQQLRDQAILSLIFQSGVSTSAIITDISGRGLGLAIVREKVEKLGGFATVDTRAAQGTTFELVLPMTLATFRGALIRVDEQLFVLPVSNVKRVARISRQEIQTVENRETVCLDGEAIALVRLGDVLEFSRKANGKEDGQTVRIVVLGSGNNRMAFPVDDILQEQEILVKSLGKHLARVRNVTGATILGGGQVVPILNVSDLMKCAVRLSGVGMKPGPAGPEKEGERKSVLVVEDSITARTLLKNILEAAGYDVKTAVDGVDAFTQLRSAEFDIVVSDVDMPRMSGFDLTAKIRADKKLAELPLVLVTALESREDRERGVDVGANAYIVKSSFDQSNLLEAIRRLV